MLVVNIAQASEELLLPLVPGIEQAESAYQEANTFWVQETWGALVNRLLRMPDRQIWAMRDKEGGG